MIAAIPRAERENFTIRMSPQMKQLVKILAANEHDSVSNVIEKAAISRIVTLELRNQLTIHEIAQKTGLSVEEVSSTIEELKEIQWN